MRIMRPGSRAPRRKSSMTPHYQTFPTSPPKNKGRPPSRSPRSPPGSDDDRSRTASKAFGPDHHHGASPLPVRQLAVLAFIALCEQTALNSISPYLPQMASTFPEVQGQDVGVYVGSIASAFAAAQFATNFFWGWLSDRVGRKPVIMLGTLLTAACLLAFGFCRTLWQAILAQMLMGLVNGNQGVVSTCLGEITDRSNQSKAFTYLPVVYGIGGITGPLLGGLTVGSLFPSYPYLAPNLVSAVLLLTDFLVSVYFLEESLEKARLLSSLGQRIGNIFVWVWQFASSSRPSYLRLRKARNSLGDVTGYEDTDSEGHSESETSRHSLLALLPESSPSFNSADIFDRETVLLLSTYLIFQLSNISYNSLYPIFAASAPPLGRHLSAEEIGLSLSFAGLVTILFQIGLFNTFREKMGNRLTYRVGLGGFALAFFLTPFVGYKGADNGDGGMSSGKVWLWVELGLVLLIKTVAAVGGLTSALLLITNSAPNHAILGTLNGLAQTLSAAGRAVGPFLSGGLFSLAANVRPKGEVLAFGVFGSIAFVGLLVSFGIRNPKLEAAGLESDGEDDEEEPDVDTDNDDEDAVLLRS